MKIYRVQKPDGTFALTERKPAGGGGTEVVFNSVGELESKEAADQRRAEDQAAKDREILADRARQQRALDQAKADVEKEVVPQHKAAEAAANDAAEVARGSAREAGMTSLEANQRLSQSVATTNSSRVVADKVGDAAAVAVAVTPTGIVTGFVLSTTVSALNSTSGLPGLGDQAVTSGQALGEIAGSSATAGAFKGVDIVNSVGGLFEGPDLLPALDALSLESLDKLGVAIENTDNTVLAEWFGAEDKDSLRKKIAEVRKKKAAADEADRQAAKAQNDSFRLWDRNRADEGTRIHERQMELLGRR